MAKVIGVFQRDGTKVYKVKLRITPKYDFDEEASWILGIDPDTTYPTRDEAKVEKLRIQELAIKLRSQWKTNQPWRPPVEVRFVPRREPIVL